MSTVLRPPPPLGYRFRPSNEVIITHYLIPKNEGRPLPSNHIYETTEIYGKEGLETTFRKGIQHYREYASFDERYDDSLYFFTKLKKKWQKCSRISRTAGAGTWKGDNGKDIYSDKSYKVRKTNLTFNVKGKRKIPTSDGYVTWNMEEYSVEKDEINFDYVIVKIKKKISKKDKAADVAVQGGPDDTEVDEAVLPEQPAAAHNMMQYQLPIAGQYFPSTNFQSAMDNAAAFQQWQNTNMFLNNVVPVSVVFPVAEDNHQQYQPSSSTIESPNVNSAFPEFWGDCQVEPNAAAFQPFPSSSVHQDAVFPSQQQLQSCCDPLSYNIPSYEVPPFDSYTFCQYPLPSGYPHETVVPPLADAQQDEFILDLSASWLEAAVGPLSAEDLIAIGGDNAAVEDHNQECSNDTLVANSEAEAVQPQKNIEGHF